MWPHSALVTVIIATPRASNARAHGGVPTTGNEYPMAIAIAIDSARPSGERELGGRLLTFRRKRQERARAREERQRRIEQERRNAVFMAAATCHKGDTKDSPGVVHAWSLIETVRIVVARRRAIRADAFGSAGLTNAPNAALAR